MTALEAVCIRGYNDDDQREAAEIDGTRVTIVQMLLGAGASLAISNKRKKNNPLHWACFHGDTELIKVKKIISSHF